MAWEEATESNGSWHGENVLLGSSDRKVTYFSRRLTFPRPNGVFKKGDRWRRRAARGPGSRQTAPQPGIPMKEAGSSFSRMGLTHTPLPQPRGSVLAPRPGRPCGGHRPN